LRGKCFTTRRAKGVCPLAQVLSRAPAGRGRSVRLLCVGSSVERAPPPWRVADLADLGARRRTRLLPNGLRRSLKSANVADSADFRRATSAHLQEPNGPAGRGYPLKFLGLLFGVRRGLAALGFCFGIVVCAAPRPQNPRRKTQSGDASP